MPTMRHLPLLRFCIVLHLMYGSTYVYFCNSSNKFCFILKCVSLLYVCDFMECLLYDLFVHWVDFFFCSSIYLILVYAKPQMPPRRDPSNNNDNADAVQQLIAAQAQMMQMMTQFFQNQNQNQNQHNNNPPPPPPPVDRLARFLRLRPNRFSTASEPMVADDRLHSVNKDLFTCECTDAEKIRFTAHLLEGPAATWWETYQITHPINTLDWDTFREGFRNAHISSGVMNMKKEEFRSLRQGG